MKDNGIPLLDVEPGTSVKTAWQGIEFTVLSHGNMGTRVKYLKPRQVSIHDEETDSDVSFNAYKSAVISSYTLVLPL